MTCFDSLPNEIIINILFHLSHSASSLVNISGTSHLLYDVSSFQDIWRKAYKIKWAEEDKKNKKNSNNNNNIDNPNNNGDEDGGNNNNNNNNGDNDVVGNSNNNNDTEKDSKLQSEEEKKKKEEEEDSDKDWKLMYKQRAKQELEVALQKASAAALRYQAKIALLQTKKREYDGYITDLTNKRAKIEGQKSEAEKESAPVGWHPTFVQDHFDEQERKRKTTLISKNLLQLSSSFYSSSESSSQLKARYDAAVKNRAMSEQVRAKIRELSNEMEVKKAQIRKELKRFND